jgi:hypothetical protein
VRDARGIAVAEAFIGGDGSVTQSDETGAFEDVAPGKFTLRCAAPPNSVSCSVDVELAEGETRNVVLDPEAP